MSPNRRIFLNIIATYGRSLYALMLGLFTARWALMALGQVDYGLYGVVGGLAAFISFINGLFSTAVGRFYAVEVGRASVATDKRNAIEECRKWFSTAVFIHVLLPTVLMVIGYPIGNWAVRNFLDIPADRVNDCVWVFRFVCVSCYLGMVAVPFSAMYTAKQYIAELTVYSFATTTLNAAFLYYMVTHPGVWLAKYAFWMCLMSILPAIVIAVRACFIFPECHLSIKYCASKQRFRELLYYVGWWAFGQTGGLLRNQGIQILVNKYFGARTNAAMTVQTSVTGHTMMLSSAMNQAFQPAIVAAYGAGEYDRMRALAYRACKFSMLLTLFFMLPLGLELEEVLRIWLVTPPKFVYGLCLIAFVMTIIDQSAVGHMLAVNACGKIAKYQIFLGGALLLTLPLAWLFCYVGLNVYFVGLALLITMTFCAWGRVWFARGLVGMSAKFWLERVMLPVILLIIVCLAIGIIPRICLPPGLIRIFVTISACELAFVPLAWFVILSDREREYIYLRIFKCVR